MALTQTEVSQLYVSILFRASEGDGNSYWMTDPASTDMTTTANIMLNTDAAIAYFGSTMDDNAAFVAHIYTNTLGKSYADDSAGQDYWVAELDAGKSKGEMIAALITAAQLTVNAGDAQDQFNNYVTISNYVADTIAVFTDIATFRAYLYDFDIYPCVTNATAAADADVPGQTFTLSVSTTSDIPSLTAFDDVVNATQYTSLGDQATGSDAFDSLEPIVTLQGITESDFLVSNFDSIA